MIRCFIFMLLYLLDITWVRGDCIADATQQLQSMHDGASEVKITWIGDAPQVDDVFHSIEGRHTSMKPHTFVLVCANDKQYKGRAEPCMRVPVVTNDVSKGEIIQQVESHSIPCRLVNKRIVQTPESIVGMQAKTIIKAMQPISEHQVEKPRLVKKGDNITIQYQTPFFVITNQGVAQSDGAQGDTIGVTCQKKTLNARVVNLNLVKIDRL